MSTTATTAISLSSYTTLFVGLFAMMNPFGNAAIFLSLTSSQTDANKKQTAMSCSFAVMIILFITVWIGTYLLELFGISIYALTVAGGIIVLLIGLNMLNSGSSGSTTSSSGSNVGVVPLAIPLIAGPGTMSTILAHTYLLASFESKCFVSIVCFLMALVIMVVLLSANKIEKLLGANGLQVITRIMGLVLCGIAIQLLATGLPELFPILAKAAAT